MKKLWYPAALALAFGLFLNVNSALAAAPTTVVDSGSYTSAIYEVENIFTQGASDLAAGTVPFAEKILAYIALFLVLRIGFVSLLSTFDGAPVMGYMFKSLIETSLVVGLLLFFIQNFGMVTGALNSFFAEFETALGVAGRDGLSSILQTLWRSISQLYSGTVTVGPSTDPSSTIGMLWDTIWNAIPGANWIGSAITWLIVAMVKVIIIALLCWMAFKITLAYMIATFSIALAMAVGPVFIAFRAGSATEFLFEGWLKFTIKAYFVKVVLFLILTLAGSAMAVADTQMQTALANDAFLNTFMSLFAAVTIAYILVNIVDEASSIANEIISGSFSGKANRSGNMAMGGQNIMSTASKGKGMADSAQSGVASGARTGARAMARGVGKGMEAYAGGKAALARAAAAGPKGVAMSMANGVASRMANGQSSLSRAGGKAAQMTRVAMKRPLNKPLTLSKQR